MQNVVVTWICCKSFIDLTFTNRPYTDKTRYVTSFLFFLFPNPNPNPVVYFLLILLCRPTTTTSRSFVGELLSCFTSIDSLPLYLTYLAQLTSAVAILYWALALSCLSIVDAYCTHVSSCCRPNSTPMGLRQRPVNDVAYSYVIVEKIHCKYHKFGCT